MQQIRPQPIMGCAAHGPAVQSGGRVCVFAASSSGHLLIARAMVCGYGTLYPFQAGTVISSSARCSSGMWRPVGVAMSMVDSGTATTKGIPAPGRAGGADVSPVSFPTLGLRADTPEQRFCSLSET